MARALRIGWTALAAALVLLLGTTYATSGLVLWGLATGLPWLLGARALLGPRAPRVADAVRALGRSRGGALAVGVAGFLLVLVAKVFSPVAMLTLATWAGAAALEVAARRGGAGLRAFVQTFALLAASLAACAVLLEAVLRLPTLTARLGTGPQRARDEAAYDRLWERNVLGFRTPHERLAKDPDTLRVLALGDSFTWGDKIADTRDTWPARLEWELRRHRSGPVEVVNLAEPGFTLANEAELLRRLGWAFAPDLLLVQFYLNDVLPSGPDLAREQHAWLQPPRRVLPSSWRRGLVERSVLLEVVERASARRLDGGRPGLRSLYRDDFVGWQQLEAALHEMGAAARARDVPALLLLFPRLHEGAWTAEEHPDRFVHRRVARTAREAGLAVLDLTAVFAGPDDARRWWARPYDAHPNEAANARVARHVARWLRGQGLP